MKSKQARLFLLASLVLLSIVMLFILIKPTKANPFNDLLVYSDKPVSISYWHKEDIERPTTKNIDYNQVINIFDNTKTKSMNTISTKAKARFTFNYGSDDDLIQLIIYENNQIMLTMPNQDLPLIVFLEDINGSIFKEIQNSFIE